MQSCAELCRFVRWTATRGRGISGRTKPISASFAAHFENAEAKFSGAPGARVLRILGWGVVAKLGHRRPVWSVNFVLTCVWCAGSRPWAISGWTREKLSRKLGCEEAGGEKVLDVRSQGGHGRSEGQRPGAHNFRMSVPRTSWAFGHGHPRHARCTATYERECIQKYV